MGDGNGWTLYYVNATVGVCVCVCLPMKHGEHVKEEVTFRRGRVDVGGGGRANLTWSDEEFLW